MNSVRLSPLVDIWATLEVAEAVGPLGVLLDTDQVRSDEVGPLRCEVR